MNKINRKLQATQSYRSHILQIIHCQDFLSHILYTMTGKITCTLFIKARLVSDKYIKCREKYLK